MKLSQIVTEQPNQFDFHTSIAGYQDHGFDVKITYYEPPASDSMDAPANDGTVEFELYHDRDSRLAGQRAIEVEDRLTDEQRTEIETQAHEAKSEMGDPRQEYRDDLDSAERREDRLSRM